MTYPQNAPSTAPVMIPFSHRDQDELAEAWAQSLITPEPKPTPKIVLNPNPYSTTKKDLTWAQLRPIFAKHKELTAGDVSSMMQINAEFVTPILYRNIHAGNLKSVEIRSVTGTRVYRITTQGRTGQ